MKLGMSYKINTDYLKNIFAVIFILLLLVVSFKFFFYIFFQLIAFIGWVCSSVAVLDKIDIGLDQELAMPEVCFP